MPNKRFLLILVAYLRNKDQTTSSESLQLELDLDVYLAISNQNKYILYLGIDRKNFRHVFKD